MTHPKSKSNMQHFGPKNKALVSGAAKCGECKAISIGRAGAPQTITHAKTCSQSK